jgi:UDP-glucose 4-epimerase
LPRRGYELAGLDNFSKYGKVAKSYDDHPHYQLVEGDARDVGLMTTCWRTATTSSPARR